MTLTIAVALLIGIVIGAAAMLVYLVFGGPCG